MFLMKLLRSMTGTDADTRSEEARLLKNLDGMASTNRDLDRLDEELGVILSRIEEQGRMYPMSLPPMMSGEHKPEEARDAGRSTPE
jgi:hypothetical protein